MSEEERDLVIKEIMELFDELVAMEREELMLPTSPD